MKAWLFALVVGLGALVALSGCLTRLPTVAPLTYDPADAKGPYELLYARPEDPYLMDLRKEFALDQVIAGATTEMEKIRAVNT